MSLPSNAQYFDKDKNLVGKEFVNCGWFLNAETLYRVLTELQEIPDNAHSVIVYGFEIPVAVVRKAIAMPDIRDVIVDILSDLIHTANEEYQRVKYKNGPNIGEIVRVNGHGDLAMDSDAKKFIGKYCTVIKKCKSGLYQVKRWYSDDKETISLPKYNLTW